MFTGLITHTGTITQLVPQAGILQLAVEVADSEPFVVGESVAVDGVCLTVVRQIGRDIHFEAVQATQEATTLKAARIGQRVNLERALKVGDRLGGHFVQGHVDDVGEILSWTEEGENFLLRVRAPLPIMQALIVKGSIAVDGVSLTIQAIEADTFTVAIIPYTRTHTTFQHKEAGAAVNLEIDLIQKGVKSQLATLVAALRDELAKVAS